MESMDTRWQEEGKMHRLWELKMINELDIVNIVESFFAINALSLDLKGYLDPFLTFNWVSSYRWLLL